MKIILNNSSMRPIYEQIVSHVKEEIISGNMKTEEMLPSVRNLSKELRISALTVKKAYDALEQEGFIVTVQGKGSFVTAVNSNLKNEEQKKNVEKSMEETIRMAKRAGMTKSDIEYIFELLMEE